MRGACMSCSCVEFTFDGTHRCSDCGCKSAKHKNLIASKDESQMPLLGRKNSNKKGYMEKVNSVKIMENHRTAALLASQRRIAMIWLITSSIWAYTCFQNRPEKIGRGISDGVYLYASSVFFMGIFFATMGYLSSKNDDRKKLSEILIIVNMIAMLSHLLKYFRLTPSLRDVNGYPVDFARFFEWNATCPTYISLISVLTRDITHGKKTVAIDYILLSAGFLGAILRSPYSYISLAVAVGAYFYVVSGLFKMFNHAIYGRTMCKLDRLSLLVTRGVTVLSWTSFPVIFFSVRFKLVSFPIGELLFAMADIVSKVFVTMLLINASVEELQNNKVEVLVGIAEEMSQDLDKTETLLGRMMPEE